MDRLISYTCGFFSKCVKIDGLLLELLPWPHRLAVRTLASHAGNRGSIPLGAISNYLEKSLTGFHSSNLAPDKLQGLELRNNLHFFNKNLSPK